MSAIRISNLKHGEELTYSLPLLVGEVTPPIAQGSIKLSNQRTGDCITWPIFNGMFKGLVQLVPGINVIQCKSTEGTLDFDLTYRIPKFNRFVRPVCIKCADHDGSFQGPDSEDRSLENAQKRITLASRLLQAFTAEKMFEHGLGRKTFILEHDLDPAVPTCHVFTTKLTYAEVHAMEGGDLWMYFAKEFMSSKMFTNKNMCKWYTFMSFTRYQPPEGVVPRSHSDVMKFTKGHTALGGGGLALFGTGNLHCWAEKLEDVCTRFTDPRKINRSQYMDDSAYREYHWANYSTGLGASLHELGHTFDLAHTPTGIMARGFDDLYKVYIVHPSLGHGCTCPSSDGSRVASPIPYSPKQSPIHRPKPHGSRSSSPKPCPLIRPRLRMHSGSDVAVAGIVQIEAAFKKLVTQSTQTCILKNYDGSETKRTIIRHRDGTETISEYTTYPSGEQLARETIKHVASGKTRTTMSMSINRERTLSESSDTSTSTPSSSSSSLASSSSSPSSSQSHPSELPHSPEGEQTEPLSFQEVKYRDGGAHWYRASAVLLNYHKWFNAPDPKDPGIPPVLRGTTIHSNSGLRLLELRTVPDGVVFHHWEFLHDRTPHAFRLRHAEVAELSHNAAEITVVAEDHYGNILKKKVSVAELRDSAAKPRQQETKSTAGSN